MSQSAISQIKNGAFRNGMVKPHAAIYLYAQSIISSKAAFQNILGVAMSGKPWLKTEPDILTTRICVNAYIMVGACNP
jgi:hypothetical protein